MLLVSILGDFHSSIIPVFYEMKEDIKKHIIIYDDSKIEERNINKIIIGQKVISKKYNLDFEIITLKIDEDNHSEIIACYNHIIRQSNREYEKIYINGTDGLVSSIVIFANKLINLGANFIAYDKFDNQYNLITKDSMCKITLKNNSNIKDHLIQKGYKLEQYPNENELNFRKKSIYKICNDLKRVQEFANVLQQRKIDDIEGFTNIKNELKKIDKLNVSFVQGTIFEEYIYWLIKDNLDFDDVMVGVKVQINENLYNEFDILMIKDNHLHTIECKLRKKVDGENLVYKLDSLLTHLDDDGKGMLLVVGGSNKNTTFFGNIKTQFSKGTKARAGESQIKIYQEKYFEKDIFLKSVEDFFVKKEDY